MKIAFNPSTVAALTTPPNNKDITFDLRGRNIFARGVKFYGTDTNTWRDIKINNVSIGSHTLDLRNGSNTTLTNTNGVVTINSTWRPVVDNLTSDSTTSSLSAKQGKVLKALIDGKSDSDHNHDGKYLRLSGQDTMQGNLYLHSHGTSYIGKGLGDKSGADFTEANIVIRSWWGISFKSHDDKVRSYIDTRTGNIGTKGVLNAGGAVIQGRVYDDGGDDEGIIINPAYNGCAGLILGTHNGERSVFYLKKGNPFWRYNNGSTNLDIYHPKKSGTIALTSDIPDKNSWNYDDRYLRLTGGWMSGDINFGGDNKIYWEHNTDSASISFKNDGDGDANSYMSFVTSDNGNEYFRWSHSSGPTNTEWMALRSDGLRVRGTKVSLEGHTHDDRYYTKAESNAKYITDITTSVNKLTFTRNGSNIARNITVNVVYSQGNLTNISNKDNTTKASSGLYIYNSYNQVIGTNYYSSVLSINTGGTIQIAGNWGDDQTRNLYWRSQSDRKVANYPWKSWRTILDSENYSSTLDSRYYTESEVNSLLDAKLNRQNLSYGNWNPRGYHLAADYHYNGGDLSISENNGKMYISVDGCFWQNEGQYRVLDTSDVAGLKSNLTVHQFLSAADAAWYPLVWGGNSHNNTSDSTGAVYKSYDKLSWQTSSQTLYATNIQTNNIKNLSIGGGIYWNPNVESATDGTDAASITLVRSGVAGGTTLVLSQMSDTNDTIQFKTNTAARLYHNSYPILTTQNTYVSNNKGYINGTEITQVNNANKWITARTFTVGNTSKSVDGSSNVSWSLSEIGAASSNHNHDNRYVRKWTGVYGNANKFLKLVINDEKGWIRLEVSDSNNALSGGYGIYIIGWSYHGNNSTDTLFTRCLYANDSRYTTALKVVRTSRNNYDFYFQFASRASYPSYTINYSSSVSSIDYTVTAIDTIPTATWTSSLSVLQLNASQVDWSGITNKPSEFNPAAHTHTVFKNNLMIKGTNGISDRASIHLGIGDSDTGFKWISDGVCQIYANNAAVGQWTSRGMDWFKNPTVNGNKVWNSGNDGSGSGLDSDLVDGLHASRFPIYYNLNMSSTSNHWYKLGTARMSESDNIMIHIYSGDGWNSNAYQNAYATLMIKTGYNPNGGLTREFGATMVNHHHSNMTYKLISPSNNTVDIWVKIPWEYTSGWYSIHGEYSSYTHSGASQSAEPTGNAQTGVETLTNAYTSSNVASATKLATPRTIWGQSFDGTADVDNTLRIKQTTGNYCEGIRIQTADSTWATIILGATGDSGTNANAWSIHRKADNNFAISRNSSDGTNGLVMTSVGMGLGTTAPTQRLDVAGNIRATGQIIREGYSNIWVYGRNTALLRETSAVGYHTLWSLKTTNGSWDFGEYNAGSDWNNIPVLSYITDSNYNSGNNATTCQIKFPLASGTVALTSNIPNPTNYYWANVKISASSSTTTSPTFSNVYLGNSLYLNNRGSNSIYNGPNDSANGVGGPLNNLVFSSWQGVSFTTSCAGLIYTNKNAVSINCRSGQLYAREVQANGFRHTGHNNNDAVLLAGGDYKTLNSIWGGDSTHFVFLGYLTLRNGDDGTVGDYFTCLGQAVPFTYTRGGAYCRIYIPDTPFQVFYIKAAIASVHYSGEGMGQWVGNHRGDGAWWLHCDAVDSNSVQVKGFHLANGNNDSWWGGNPLYSGDGAAKMITVCLFGYVRFK